MRCSDWLAPAEVSGKGGSEHIKARVASTRQSYSVSYVRKCGAVKKILHGEKSEEARRGCYVRGFVSISVMIISISN